MNDGQRNRKINLSTKITCIKFENFTLSIVNERDYMPKKKKVTIDGSFGPRYGANVRKKWRLVMEKEKSGKLSCPKCETIGSINRVSTGVWHCRKCGATFTGGAYYTETPRGAESYRISKRKQREIEAIEE